ncbi:hypothetical protein PROSTU_00379 [Providencia stuartii ATCC 25827]|uniref:Uncharacterized protein n=1 Tax=Providencia stuartii ATCC 25827 TaxID=471874 RepID=A0AA86YR47_PROST|nr:hypothetical protein PROSTU_00379 [Providencia stuartii ATCC 25827]
MMSLPDCCYSFCCSPSLVENGVYYIFILLTLLLERHIHLS